MLRASVNGGLIDGADGLIAFGCFADFLLKCLDVSVRAINSSYGIFNVSANFLMVAGLGMPRCPFSILEMVAELTPE